MRDGWLVMNFGRCDAFDVIFDVFSLGQKASEGERGDGEKWSNYCFELVLWYKCMKEPYVYQVFFCEKIKKKAKKVNKNHK